jgi:PhnB protein
VAGTIPTSLAPWLTVRDAVRAVAFYKSAFDAVETYRLDCVRMILTVADPEAVFAKALAAGATEVCPVGNAHGWRLGRIVDPVGLHWEIGHKLA